MPDSKITGITEAINLKDQTMPNGRWEFDEKVTAVFDNMLERSIPQYEVMRKLCFSLGRAFVKPGSDILDLGCSRGAALAPFVEKFGAYNRYLGIDCSKPMLDAARARFEGLIKVGLVSIQEMDLRKEFPAARCSLILSVLTVQFTPIEYRLKILQSAYDSLLPGGALIFVEKVLGNSSKVNELLVSEYLKQKADNEYTEEQIERKKASLEGVLVPLTERWNLDLLNRVGFLDVECFWRYLNFAGFIAVKE